jgi:hypothetical protein
MPHLEHKVTMLRHEYHSLIIVPYLIIEHVLPQNPLYIFSKFVHQNHAMSPRIYKNYHQSTNQMHMESTQIVHLKINSNCAL